jgi:hypothetical protein
MKKSFPKRINEISSINAGVLYVSALIFVLLMLDMSRLPQDQVSARLLLFSIKQYQKFISPGLRGHVHCKFQPSCSHYGYTSIERYGAFWGTLKAIDRIFRCNPWNKQDSWDPP